MIYVRLDESIGSGHAIFKAFLAELIVYGSFKGIREYIVCLGYQGENGAQTFVPCSFRVAPYGQSTISEKAVAVLERSMDELIFR